MNNNNETDNVIVKLTKDLRSAVSTMSRTEARFLVDSYYQMQDNRIRADGQVRSMKEKPDERHAVLDWLSENSKTLENQVKSALDAYSRSHPMGVWAREVKGIGPVLSAGLLAHIDITQAPTVGHIWRFAGLDPTSQWIGRDNARKLVAELKDEGGDIMELIAKAASKTNRKLDNLMKQVSQDEDGQPCPPTLKLLESALAKRPWNAGLKVLTWKIGESFVKISGFEDGYYGHVYLKRKEYEAAKNLAGEYKGQAEKGAARVGKGTEAYKAYSIGMLPPGHLHARAKRYAVKLFLAHWHQVAYEKHYGKPAPLPYPIAILGHAHKIEPFN